MRQSAAFQPEDFKRGRLVRIGQCFGFISDIEGDFSADGGYVRVQEVGTLAALKRGFTPSGRTGRWVGVCPEYDTVLFDSSAVKFFIGGLVKRQADTQHPTNLKQYVLLSGNDNAPFYYTGGNHPDDDDFEDADEPEGTTDYYDLADL